MTRKRIHSLLAGMMLMSGMLTSGTATASEAAITGEARTGDNMLSNGSFEEYSCDALGCSFNDWSYPLGMGQPCTTDVVDGETSIEIHAVSIPATLDNAAYLPDDYYEAGSAYTVKMHYKVVKLPTNGELVMDCYWEPISGADAERMKMHDADVLQGVVTDQVSGEWESIEVVTTKPSMSARLRVRMIVPKGGKVLFDAFSVTQERAEDEPYIALQPISLSPVKTTINNPVDFPTVHIEQENVTGVTTFALGGKDANMFRIDVHTCPASVRDTNIIITYAPTSVGTHEAILQVSNSNHTELFKSIHLSGSCIDPTKQPSIQALPPTLPFFEAVEGNEKRDTVTVISENCRDYVYLRVEHIQGAAFTIDGSMAGKNANTPIQVRFFPTAAGEYESRLVIYTEGAESVTLELKGVGIKRDEGNIDWMPQFEWNETHPLTLMNETFDNILHNKTLVLDGWQNVAAVDQRPWWGFDEAKTSPVRGDGKYAKATAYQYAKDSTGTWEMFLITPALDYKNAAGKIFAFSVMGEYMPDEDNRTYLEIYYVDATGEKAYFQNLTESFGIPFTSDENNVWRTFFLDLEPYAETMADVFHIAFRYIGPNGSYGATTYYLDDISWGRTDLPQIKVEPRIIVDSTAYVDQKKTIATVEVTGKNLNNEIYLSMAGRDYKNFSLSQSSLSDKGGSFDVVFEAEEEGIYEALVVLSSSGAPDAYIPMAVLCNAPQGLESQELKTNSQKLLRDGQLYIQKNGTLYSILGIIDK